MNIAVLTSSRADYSIYFPLLDKLNNDSYFKLSLIVFGSHLSEKFGNTLAAIEADKFKIIKKVETLPSNDSPSDIASSIGETIIKFASLWKEQHEEFDLVFCLGDRYEMFAAVSAAVPFDLTFAHIHGGETTEGAIDNVFRNSITHMSKLHFASTSNHAKRISQLTGDDKNIFNVGALGLENISKIKLLTKKEFEDRYNIPIENPILVTFHPETVNYDKNEYYVLELIKVLQTLNSQIIITMPNSDTMGNIIRKHLSGYSVNANNVYCVESLGLQGYYSCMSMCDFVLGNSSSGIIEAASFGKYVINIGDRQKGRDFGKNVLHSSIKSGQIINLINKMKDLPKLNNENIYWGGNVSDKIINIIKSYNEGF